MSALPFSYILTVKLQNRIESYCVEVAVSEYQNGRTTGLSIGQVNLRVQKHFLMSYTKNYNLLFTV